MSAQKFVVKKKAKTGGKDSKQAPKEAKPLVKAKEEIKEEVIIRLPPAKLNMCVVGAGAVGCSIAAYLRSKLRNVFMVANLEDKKAIRSEGLRVEGTKGNLFVDLDVRDEINQKVDLVILAVDTGYIKEVINRNRSFLDNAIILTTQNSLSAEKIVSLILGEKNIVSSVLMFESVCAKRNLVNYLKDGKWYIGRPFCANDDKVKEISEELSLAFETVIVDDITCVKWAKLITSLYYCIPALLGKSLQETFADLDMAKLAVIILREGFMALDNSNIKLTNLADFSTDKLRQLTQLPLGEAAQAFSKDMANLGKDPIYGIVLENIKRGCPSEINYINGELVHLSRFSSAGADLNVKIVNFVHRVEKTKKFFSAEDIKREFDIDKLH
jgi:2-dehydropantoate 2-reductase